MIKIVSLIVIFLIFSQYHFLKNGIGKTYQGQYSLDVVLLNDFNDTLQIYLNKKLIKNELFKTNPTTGACDNKVSFTVKSKYDTLVLKSKNSSFLSIRVLYNKKKRFLYIRKNSRRWFYEFLESPKMLE